MQKLRFKLKFDVSWNNFFAKNTLVEVFRSVQKTGLNKGVALFNPCFLQFWVCSIAYKLKI